MSVKKSNLRKIISEYPVPIDYKKLVLQKNKLIIDQAKKIHKLKNNMRRMRKLRYNSCLDLKKKCLNKVESVINNNKGEHLLKIKLINYQDKYAVDLLSRNTKVDLSKDFIDSLRKINDLKVSIES